MKLAGVDLSWQSNKNPTAIAYGYLDGHALRVTSIEPAVYGINEVFSRLDEDKPNGVAIDASLIINNAKGQRPCETQIGKAYGSRGASCHSSNTSLYPNSQSVYLSQRLLAAGYNHLQGNRWQLECYPHPSIIEIFNLQERLKYKKGTVAEKRAGQQRLTVMLKNLQESQYLKLVIENDIRDAVNESHIETLRGKRLKSNEDVLDSLVCLYVAGLYSVGYTGKVFGDTESGYVWIPQGRCF